mmetsp:Transcript_41796/g.58800  ORF Transcript_41796/g.58800 Transcript_41796/m.58800 type:complete len:111 (+) Transcript_41796:166-498(+)
MASPFLVQMLSLGPTEGVCVGKSEGAGKEGCWEGFDVGKNVGEEVGLGVGIGVGSIVGDWVGSDDGVIVGIREGEELFVVVGEVEGVSVVGDMEGFPVGELDGSLDGDKD